MRTLLSLLVIAALCGSTSAKDKPAKPAADIAALSFLTGTWEGPMWDGTFRAQYTGPSKDTLLSYSQLLVNGVRKFHEFEVFESKGDKLVLTPHPGGKAAAQFTMTALDATKRRVVFEAPENDFPSRIVYHRDTDATLKITLTAPHHKSEKTKTFELTFIR